MCYRSGVSRLSASVAGLVSTLGTVVCSLLTKDFTYLIIVD